MALTKRDLRKMLHAIDLAIELEDSSCDSYTHERYHDGKMVTTIAPSWQASATRLKRSLSSLKRLRAKVLQELEDRQ